MEGALKNIADLEVASRRNENFCARMSELGIAVMPASPMSLASEPSVDAINFWSWCMALSVEAIDEVHPKELDFKSDVAIAKALIGKIPCREPSDEFWSKVEDGDILQVFDCFGRQLHQSSNFWRFCTYDSRSIYTIPWHELYDRPEEITEKLVKQSQAALAGTTGVQKYEVPPHFVKERFANVKYPIILDMKYLCPLHNKSDETQARYFISSVRPLRDALN